APPPSGRAQPSAVQALPAGQVDPHELHSPGPSPKGRQRVPQQKPGPPSKTQVALVPSQSLRRHSLPPKQVYPAGHGESGPQTPQLGPQALPWAQAEPQFRQLSG